MKTTRWAVAASLVSMVALAGCENVTDETTGAPAAGGEANGEAAAEVRTGSLRLEEAQRSLDRGDDVGAAIEKLHAIIDDDAVSSEDKDGAKLALSRALTAKGDDEGAIAVVEELLRSHSQSGPFPARDLATKRLRLLLTGSDAEESFHRPAGEVSPGARALAREFKADAEGNYLIDVYVFGTASRSEMVIGQLAEAKRRELEEALSPSISVGQSISSAGSWASLPSAMGEQPSDMPQADRSMLAFYYDLGAGRVPSRYDAYLPVPSDEIAQALEEGDGLIAFRRRPNAKPTLVIAAPRAAELAEVEQVLQAMTELPTEPVRVPLKKGLRAAEIQSVIRSLRKEFRGCYEAKLAAEPTATGRVELAFRIDGAGKPLDASFGEGSTLRGATFEACMLGAVQKLQFAATGETTNVTYPLLMTP